MADFENAVGGSALLNTGFFVPLIGLGTYKIKGKKVKECVDGALKGGYRMFDTAKYYENEVELGQALKELLPKYGLERKDIFITTKFFPPPTDCSAESRRLVEESLTNLHTDYIDMYLVHYPKHDSCENDDPNNKEHRKLAYLEMEKMKGEGKIRSVGVSNFEPWHLEEIKSYGKMMPCANQVEFHPHFARTELKDYCKKEGIFFQAFSSLARFEPKLIDDQVVVKIAKDHNTDVPSVLMAWAVDQGVGIVPKSENPQRIIDNFKSVTSVHLSADEVADLLKLDCNKSYIRCTGWLVK